MAARRAAPARQRRSAPPSPEELELAVAILRERLQAEGALKVSSIAPKSARAELCARLVAEGYELGGTWLRRPVREQLREALGHGAALARPGLAAAVRGASAAELARVVSELERGGELYRVLRGKSETIVGASAPVLPPAALEPLVAPLSRALAAAAGPGAADRARPVRGRAAVVLGAAAAEREGARKRQNLSDPQPAPVLETPSKAERRHRKPPQRTPWKSAL